MLTTNLNVLTSAIPLMRISPQNAVRQFRRQAFARKTNSLFVSLLLHLAETEVRRPRTSVLNNRSRPPVQGGMGEGEKQTSKFQLRAAKTSRTLCSLAAGQGKVHLHRRFHFDRFAVEQVRLVLPLLYSFNRRRRQHRMPTDQAEILDVAGFADFCL
jgi:hypothetical protein